MNTAEATTVARGGKEASSDWQVTAPVSLLVELTHRCPLQCPYCSNPLALDKAGAELDTATWLRVLEEAAELGVLQVSFSGGEPTLRRDLEDLIAQAAGLGLYSNLITAGVLLDEARLNALIEAGLDHLQLSVQDAEAGNADRIGGYRGGHAKKLRVAELVRAAGIPLTINAVVHRQNVDNLEAIIELAEACGATRLEVAHVQYYGWALVNRAALMPTREQTERSVAVIEAAKERLKGVLAFDYVIPDYYARFPKPCMGGWAKQNLNVTPSGKVLPCHAAETITTLEFDNVKDRPLAEIWYDGAAFNAFRGTDWMAEPCRSCPRKTVDFGGCRCQAFALSGDARATDPACSLSPLHQDLVATAEREAHAAPPGFVYRKPQNSPKPAERASAPAE
ncbi:MAG TPA: pyrroloquinoline quinone biosynthesis protein PqqE [Geminicoccaceae bacterium]|jgi:pyrroloquinoline quinone biosynthesis protein E|nr:pyrroloquinoline quinone biosynthesis protein PqqE [Geminicoccaceae bacterium]